MQLSILIPTVPRRLSYLNRLLDVLAPQITPEVELIIEMDAPGQRSIGAKRNAMIKKATGDFVSWIDDDDLVDADYVSEILAGIDKGVDVVCVRGEFFQNGDFKATFVDQPGMPWDTRMVDGQLVMIRGLQHLDAIRRDIAMRVEFPDQGYGEDHIYDKRVEDTGLVIHWHTVSKPIYRYEWRSPKVV